MGRSHGRRADQLINRAAFLGGACREQRGEGQSDENSVHAGAIPCVCAVSYWKYPDWALGDHSNRLGSFLDSREGGILRRALRRDGSPSPRSSVQLRKDRARSRPSMSMPSHRRHRLLGRGWHVHCEPALTRGASDPLSSGRTRRSFASSKQPLSVRIASQSTQLLGEVGKGMLRQRAFAMRRCPCEGSS